MSTTETTRCRRRLARGTLDRLRRALLVFMLFNVVAFATQVCAVAATSTALTDVLVLPCDAEDDGCLAEMIENDATLRSRVAAVSADSDPPANPLIIIPVALERPLSRLREKPALLALQPLRLQLCRLLI
jgi:hypothetical protein